MYAEKLSATVKRFFFFSFCFSNVVYFFVHYLLPNLVLLTPLVNEPEVLVICYKSSLYVVFIIFWFCFFVVVFFLAKAHFCVFVFCIISSLLLHLMLLFFFFVFSKVDL